ncbi:MAG TPA: hypothetical protein DDX54_06910 [Rhodospirillaceae bacterium]|jgi:phosphatidate cytidylyltransferase|nr:phosphatidate cytidylyltransferase [Alphaproteobacteria bacterium]HBH27113.1 hypothetical protein [Rhodospirillaceae bacterium]
MTSLQKRLASAAVLAPLAGIILWHGGWPFAAMVVLVAALALIEWTALARRSRRPWAFGATGLAYVGLAVYGAHFLHGIGDHIKIPGLYMMDGDFAFWFFVCLILSDVFAYVFGKLFKGPKVFPRISPNKTWSGVVGACVGPALPLAFFGWLYGDMRMCLWGGCGSLEDSLFIALYTVVGIFAGCAVGLLGQAGDLLISALKRAAGVKDSGDLIPGHGGVLDRVDSLLLPCALFGLWALLA